MQKILFFLIPLFALTASCNSQKKNMKEQICEQINQGNFAAAKELILSELNRDGLTDEARNSLRFISDSLNRVELDFHRTKDEVIAWIEKNRGFTPSDSMLEAWEKSKALEFRIINGKKRYFRNAAPNIFRVDTAARELSQIPAPKSDTPRDSLLIDAFTQKTPSNTKGKYLLPKKRITVHYTLTIDADAVPDGETVRAWLPFPRKDVGRQPEAKLIAASQENYTLSDDKTAHTSIYMEQKAKKGKPTVFSVDFEITAQGEWFNLSEITVNPYNKKSDLFKIYTAERAPHILFSDNIRKLADSITQHAKTPVENLQAIYRYITARYPWASALEYSTIANIPQYVIANRKGDCGQVALLLITMLRYKGIPARWQSGWMTHPEEVNLHDWAEAYFEGTGWVPVDVSFGRGGAINIDPGREFFMSGIDSYRLYVNSDYSGAFFPKKQFPRSETVDFQRGEVETRDWNIYFNQWDYHIEVTYLD